jgi:hypothetical protein
MLERAHENDAQALALCLPQQLEQEPDFLTSFADFLHAFPETAPVVFNEDVGRGLVLSGIAAELDEAVEGDASLPAGTFWSFGMLVTESDGGWAVAPPGELHVLNLGPVDGQLEVGQELLEFAAEESSGDLTEPSARVWVDGVEVEVESVRPLLDPAEDIGRYHFVAELEPGNQWVAVYLEQPEGDRTGGLVPLVVP